MTSLEQPVTPVPFQRDPLPENKTAAREWLYHAKRDLETVELLLDAEHYSDVIGSNLHNALSKIFNAILVYHGQSVSKTHRLDELRKTVRPYYAIDDFAIIELLECATECYESRFEACNEKPLDKECLDELHHLAAVLFTDISKLLGIQWRRHCRM